MEEGKIRSALEGLDLSLYFSNLNGPESFLSILFE
jgi:hypothetical protein